MAIWNRTSHKLLTSLFYFICIIVFASGQYYRLPKEDIRQDLSLYADARQSSDAEEKQFQIKATTRGSPFEGLVNELFDEFMGQNFHDVEIELELELSNVSAQCMEDFTQFTSDIFGKEYALTMLDAAGKVPSGILQGNLQWLGRYDQCIAVKPNNFTARYCSTRFTSYAKKPILPIPFITIGICVPRSCSSDDITSLYYQGVLAVPLQLLEYYPYTTCGEDAEWGAGSILGLIIFSFLGLLVITGTGVEIFRCIEKKMVTKNPKYERHEGLTNGNAGKELSEPETMAQTVNGSINNEHQVDVSDKIQLVAETDKSTPSLGERALLCFSALTNGKKILTVQTGGPHSNLAALNGIRVLSMCWVILGHSHLFANSLLDNVSDSAEYFQRFSFQAVSNATFSVDSFFVLSGMLVTYFALRELKTRNGNLNWVMFYFHRFWRLTPVYMLTILLWTTLTPHFASGPYWHTLYTDMPGTPSGVTQCRKYWWTNLLYINNLIPQYLGQECLGWSWYLANDMQFYVISPVILYFLYRYSAIGLTIIGTLATTCFTSLAVISYKYDLSPSVAQPDFSNTTNPHGGDLIYIKPWTRINSYLVGMLAGYALYLWANKHWRMPKWATLLGWAYAVATGIGMVYGLYRTFHGHNQTQAQAIFYNTVSRTLWSSAVAWVCIACATGNGGPVNTLLSWSAFVPLARLTYCAYLLHPIIMGTYYLSRVVPIHYTDFTMVYFFLGHLVLAFASAYIMSVCAEAPFMALEKLMLPKKEAPKVKEDKSKQSDC